MMEWTHCVEKQIPFGNDSKKSKGKDTKGTGEAADVNYAAEAADTGDFEAAGAGDREGCCGGDGGFGGYDSA